MNIFYTIHHDFDKKFDRLLEFYQFLVIFNIRDSIIHNFY